MIRVRPFATDAEEKKKLDAGNWDSIHVVEVRSTPGAKSAAYKLTSTIMLRIATDHSVSGNRGALNLSGSLTRQQEQSFPAAGNAAHVANMGRMVEDMENRMRDTIQARRTRFAAQHTRHKPVA